MISFTRTEVRSLLRAAVIALVAALAGVADTGCRVLSKVEDCRSDGDCAGAERCHPQGHFCEKLSHLVVGVTVGKTGPIAATSANILAGLEFAAATINANGGVLGVPIVLDVLDDEGDDELAAQNARTLVERGVVGMVGPLRSSQMLKAQAVTYPAKVLHMAPVSGANALGESQPAHDRYLFQTITSIRRGSSSAIVRFAAGPVDDNVPRTAPPCERMAVLHSDDVTGNEYASSIASLMAKNGACVTLDVAFPPESKADYVAEVGKLINARPQCAALIALPPVGAAILREFEKQKAAKTPSDWTRFAWYGTTTLHSADFLDKSRVDRSTPTPSFAEGFMGADVDTAPTTAEYADFRFAYNAAARTSGDAPNLSAQAFDAIVLLALALEYAGSAHDRVAIRDGIYAVSRDGERIPAFGPGTIGDALRAAHRGKVINYQGASGGIELDEHGVVSNPTLIWRVANGAFAPSPFHYTDAQTAAVDNVNAPRTCP